MGERRCHVFGGRTERAARRAVKSETPIRAELIDELLEAIWNHDAPVHDGRWGKAYSGSVSGDSSVGAGATRDRVGASGRAAGLIVIGAAVMSRSDLMVGLDHGMNSWHTDVDPSDGAALTSMRWLDRLYFAGSRANSRAASTNHAPAYLPTWRGGVSPG